MQTFLPYAGFEQSAKVLDNKRLGKQRVEVYQILKTLQQGPYTEKELWSITGAGGKYITVKTPWYNHPAVQMWKGYEVALVSYGLSICREWMQRGFKDTLYSKIESFYKDGKLIHPEWLRDIRLRSSHRSNLLRKDFQHYSKFGWSEPDNLPYFWPTKSGY